MASVLRWVGGYFGKRKFLTLFIATTALIEPMIYMYTAFLSADIIGIIEQGGRWSEVWKVFVIFIPVIVVQTLTFFTSGYANEVLAHRVTTDMTYDLFNTFQNRSLTYHDEKDVGEIMARATNDTRAVNIGLSPGLRFIISTLSVWAVGLFVVNLFSRPLLFVWIATMVLFAVLTFFYARSLAPLNDAILQETSEISSIASDSFNGIRDLKSYVAQHWVKRNFFKRTMKQSRLQERRGIIGAWFYPDVLMRIVTVFSVGFLLYQTALGLTSFAELVLLISILGIVNGMGSELNWVSFVTIQSYIASRRLHEIVFDEDPHFIIEGNEPFSGIEASIEFEEVTFIYLRSNIPALDRVSFRIGDSETLAIVGSPGGGKSTLTKLIQRLYSPTSGRILIGGKDLSVFSDSSLRKEIATVEQDVFLFNDSILENIRFGKPEATIDEVISAAKIAHAHDFIMEFPDGYNTLVGDNGVRLSGGQAQRVAIARAIIIDPQILILDDGASALDAKTEIQIQQAISDVLRTRTTLITTHRLAIIAQADKILILDKGRVVGFGSHEELIKGNVFYRKLFERHFELPEYEVKV